MRKDSESAPDNKRKKQKVPLRTTEGRENFLVSLAMDQAEKMLLNGTAPTGVLVHFLKAGAEKARLERTKIEADTKLAIAKVEIMESQKRSEEIAEKALQAFKSYAGLIEEEEEYYDD